MTATPRNFDKDAQGWDSNPTRLKLAEDVVRAMTAAVRFEPAMDVLDFGCGTGLVTLALAPLVRSVTGADTSPGMLDVLKAKTAERGLANVRTQLLRPDQEVAGSYDAIVSSMTFHHVERLDALLAALFTALKPGGRLCAADLDSEQGEFHDNPDGVFHNGFDRATLREALLKAGFTGITVSTAAQITKPGRSGAVRPFSVFLITTGKP